MILVNPGTAHTPVQHTYRYSTNTGTAHIPVQHIYRYSTYTGTAHIPVQHIHRYSTHTGTAHIPVQHIYQYSTYTGTAHIPVQHIHQYSTHTATAHIPVQQYTGTAHIPVQHIYRYSTYTGTAHIPVQHIYRYSTYTSTAHIPVPKTGSSIKITIICLSLFYCKHNVFPTLCVKKVKLGKGWLPTRKEHTSPTPQHGPNTEPEPATRPAKTNDKPTSTAYIPYIKTTYGRLSRLLAKHNIKSVALPPTDIFSYLPPVKDALGLRTPGIYSIPYECGRVYIGQSGRSSNSESKSTTDI
jgi:hypothetical protein